MPSLFGQTLGKQDLLRRLGAPGAAAGIRLCRFEDGPERGVRFLEVRTGTGLAFTVLVDRGMDLGDLDYQGVPIGWQSAAGFRAPWLVDQESEGGQGLMRAFSGFLVTCGLDHARRPEHEKAAQGAPADAAVFHPQHGRGTLMPARLIGYGADWEEDELLIWAEGEMRQFALAGENLRLRRRIETHAGSNRIRLIDTIANDGFRPTPHMMLYHLNIGWPLLDEGSRVVAPIRDTQWANLPPAERRSGALLQKGPSPDFPPQLYVHRVEADAASRVPAALINDRLGLGLMLDFDHRVLPWLQQWQCFADGIYAVALEPCTNRFASRAELLRAGELKRLEPGQSIRHEIAIDILAGPSAIAEAEARIAKLAPHPPDDMPEATGATTP